MGRRREPDASDRGADAEVTGDVGEAARDVDLAAPALDPIASPRLARIAALVEGAGKERLAFMFVMSVAAGIVLPLLGSTGFFDPWETHYGEVARQMAERDDYLYPFWKNAYFFSKPILLFWLTGPLYALIGAGHAERELPMLTELVGRLPIALFGLFMVAIVTLTARRLFGLRAAVFTGLALSTMPYFDFISRQAITDMLYVAPMSSAICLLALAFFDDEGRDRLKNGPLPRWLVVVFALTVVPQTWEIGRNGAFLNRVSWLGSEQATRLAASVTLTLVAVGFFVLLAKKARDPLLHAAAALLALATLGKGPHAVALAVLPFALYFLSTGDWRLVLRPAVLTASALYLAIAAPWVIVMLLFEGKDEGQKTWFTRFVLYDLFGRLGGVHGERGTFEYYVRYLAFGMFPWAPLLPIALLDAAAARLKPRGQRTVDERFTLFVLIWAVAYFTFFTVTETKFHHYIFPVVVPAAFLIGRWLDRLVEERAVLPVGLGIVVVLATIVVGRDFASQPWQLVDLFTYHYVSYKPDYYFPGDAFFRALLGGVALVVTIVISLGLIADRRASARAASVAAESTPQAVRGASSTGGFLASLASLGRVVVAGTSSTKNGAFVLALFAGAVCSAIVLVHVYMAQVSQHWSHRALLRTYWSMAQPGEPLISYQMDWKGETFYAHNTDIQIKKDAAAFKKAIEKPGREFVLVQQDRLNRVKSALPGTYQDSIQVVDRSNKKWFLVVVDEPSEKASGTREKKTAPE